jgi:hypothetical protein
MFSAKVRQNSRRTELLGAPASSATPPPAPVLQSLFPLPRLRSADRLCRSARLERASLVLQDKRGAAQLALVQGSLVPAAVYSAWDVSSGSGM